MAGDNSLQMKRDLLDSRRRSSSTGLMNFSQSCVPLGTMRSSCSATTMPSAYDRLVLLMVVMKSEPPGCAKRGGGTDFSRRSVKEMRLFRAYFAMKSHPCGDSEMPPGSSGYL